MKSLFCFLSLVLITLSFAAFGQDAPPAELNTLFVIIGPFISQYAEKYPILAQIISVMVTARLIVKPLMSALLTIGKDTEIKFLKPLQEISDGKIYKTVAFVLDWVLSIKLPKKTK